MSTLDVRRDGPVAHVYLNRPELRNAFNDGVITELSQAFTNIVVSPIPPYRIDIHDVFVRALGVLIMYGLFSLGAALYRWKVPTQRQRYGLASFVDALIRRI